MNEGQNLASRVRAAAQSSELIRAVRSVTDDGGVAFALDEARLRSLSDDEVQHLERLGNSADDWSTIHVAEPFDPRTVCACSFHGQVVLGRFTKSVRLADGIEVPSGVYRSTLANCVVGNDVLVHDVRLLGNYVAGSESVLLNCGTICCDAETAFGNGAELPVALETGGREVAVFAEIDVATAAVVARARFQADLLKQYAAAVADYAAQATGRRGIIAPGAILRDTTQVRNTYVGPHAQVDGATMVADCTLLSNKEEPVKVQSGAYVTQSLLQWGSHVTTMAIVDRSVLTEHSHVERHGKVTDSVIGPNTGVAEGEVTACLLGPFVGFHHQALLIAVLWPEGKGNVGYGANVGSNHTSKAPDQEFWPGEGAFLGLGVNVKFPSDFSRAPYSIIASGVNTLPQRIAFPFSLVNSPSAQYPGISPAYNEIMPAWLLIHNMYTLKRNEGKYQARNKARRTHFEFDVFRPETIDLMRDACQRLEAVREVKDVYTESDIKGLGKNYMREASRRPAIDAYQFYIRHYALLGLKRRVEALLNDGQRQDIGRLLTTPTEEAVWEHQRQILAEALEGLDVVSGLRQLQTMLEQIARDVERSKAKDDQRGSRIIDDYAQVHTPAAQDKFVQQTWQETRRLMKELEELIARWQSR